MKEAGDHMSEQYASIRNTNKWETKTLVTLALLCAISVILSFVEFPLIPGIAWLKYDPSCMPAMVAGFAFGPAAGLACGLISALIHGMIMADWVGALMTGIVVAAMVVPSAALYRKNRTLKGAIIGLIISIICTLVAAIVSNLIIDPLYLGMPFEAVAALVVPALLPFNLAKACLNSVLTVIVYKSISNLITPKKNQVKGRS